LFLTARLKNSTGIGRGSMRFHRNIPTVVGRWGRQSRTENGAKPAAFG
jgi:hypothetical protein